MYILLLLKVDIRLIFLAIGDVNERITESRLVKLLKYKILLLLKLLIMILFPS